MICSRELAPIAKRTNGHRLPWIQLEDYALTDNQIQAAHQNTLLEHNTRLDVASRPNLARLTRIMVTLGIANSHPDAVVNMMTTGANMVRLNMSHQKEEWHAITTQSIRDAGNKMYELTSEIYPLGIAMNLQGPEIRTGIFRGDKNSIGYAELKEGHAVKLVTDDTLKRAGCRSCFWVSYPELPRICRPGDRILIDRGSVELRVACVREASVVCKVVKGGMVRDGKLVQLLDSVVELPQVSKKDQEHIQLASFLECDFVIINHTRSEKMVHTIKTGFEEMGNTRVCIIAKISSLQGFENFDEILRAADGILLDRASLETDAGSEKLFLVEKIAIAKCIKIGKPVILGFDVCKDESNLDMNLIANAVLNGVDTIFLKTGSLDAKETTELIKSVDVVCREAESARWQKEIFYELGNKVLIPADPAQAISIGAVETSLKLNAAAIVVTTTTGRSAVLLSMYRPRCPILAVTRYGVVARWLQLYYGVHPFHYKKEPLSDWSKDIDARVQSGIDSMRRKRYIKVGDAVVVVSTWRENTGFTNTIRVIYATPGHSENEVPDLEVCW
ncbi:pyruvate kinase PKM-like [Hylaeus anthracinus]|uniref:pyruvate kinase PKM-like n=1 Tax=Hylaeus anthracinus TaxID=313031 RepID=UPI0023B89B98|nr:pyruvate kinase PKM-like [Hylaeus anthracinus]